MTLGLTPSLHLTDDYLQNRMHSSIKANNAKGKHLSNARQISEFALRNYSRLSIHDNWLKWHNPQSRAHPSKKCHHHHNSNPIVWPGASKPSSHAPIPAGQNPISAGTPLLSINRRVVCEKRAHTRICECQIERRRSSGRKNRERHCNLSEKYVWQVSCAVVRLNPEMHRSAISCGQGRVG